MMKKLLLALALWPSLAWAQFATTTTTAPIGDSTNRIASTGFVANQTRIVLSAPLTLFVDNVAGSDSNDGLTSGTAFATMAKAFSVATTNYDTRGNNITVQAAASQSWTNISYSGYLAGGGALVLNLNGGTVTSSTANIGAITIYTGVGSTVTSTGFILQNATITCSGGGIGLEITSGFVILGTGNTFGSCPGGIHIEIDSQLSRLLAQAGYTISGGAANHEVSIASGLIDFNTAAFTRTITGTPAFSSSFALAQGAGIIFDFMTNSGSATGKRYIANTNGTIFTNFGGPNALPGNVAGAISTGGSYDSPGTPTIQAASCGTSPGPIVGTDQSGLLLEGTTATGCTINFSTTNTPVACTASLNSAVAVGIQALSATQLTVVHSSLSGALLSWSCPSP
jgi:hypothetical protein